MKQIYWKNEKFDVRKISPNFQIVMLPEAAQKFDTMETTPLAEKMKRYVDEILALPIDYPAPPIFTLFVFPEDHFNHYIGRAFPPKGMCGLYVKDIPHFPMALAVDDNWFMDPQKYPETVQQHIGLVHELAHIVHGAFFAGISQVGEGFAEALPQYVMGLSDPEQVKRASNLSTDKIASMEELHEKGMFPTGESETNIRTQYRRTYMSAYLWMRGYLQQVEKRQKSSKINAVNFVLQEFGKIDKTNASIKDKMAAIAALVGYSENDVYRSNKLQLLAQSSIKNENGNQQKFLGHKER